MNPSDTAAIVSAIVAIASAAVASFGVYIPWRDQHDNRIYEQAVLSLERAYKALSNDGKNVKPALADRLNWLTAARNILGYQELKARVKTDLYKLLCEEHEEFWRHQFYLCLDMHNIHHAAYYDEGPPPERRQQIEPRSALIIYGFASWPKKKSDRIESVDIKALLSDCDRLAGNHGLREYLKKFPCLVSET